MFSYAFDNKPATFLLIHRYLQYLASTRLQHLERIQKFTAHAHSQISKPTAQESAAFSRSYSFLEFAMLEAAAVQSFADGLSQVGRPTEFEKDFSLSSNFKQLVGY